MAEANPQNIITDTKKCIKSRNVLGILGFLGFANVYAMRVNLSVAIVAMINSTTIVPAKNSSTDVCPSTDSLHGYYDSVSFDSGEFNWDENQRAVVLGSFFYGYVLTQIPGGRWAELYGGKKVFGFGVFFTALFTVISPIVATWSYSLFVIIRVLEGLAEGVTFPAMHAMLARWIPPDERSKFSAVIYAGSHFGTVISFPISGWLCTLDFAGGWPLCFYIFGITGFIWSIFWFFFVFDTPISHPRISSEERDFIISSIGAKVNQQPKPIPWVKFLTCLPLWAILVTQCGYAWQFYTQLTELPTYMKNILHMGIKEIAVYSALPYFFTWVGGITISVIADYLVSKNIISRVNSFRFWNSIATVIPSFGILGVAWVGCNKLDVILLLSITSIFSGAVYSGHYMNAMSLSPQYAGTMFGITNSAANICGFLAPSAVGLLIEGKETLGQWRVVFYMAAAFNLACNLFYLAFASATEENWSLEESLEYDESTTLVPDGETS